MFTNEIARQRVADLGAACGHPLTLIEESVWSEGPFGSASAASGELSPAGSLLGMNLRAHLTVTANEGGATDLWALIFVHVNGARVAPPGADYLMLKWETADGEGSRWVARGWEADVYGEWSEDEGEGEGEGEESEGEGEGEESEGD
ncbi:hypothetical protein [Chondromyces crocatus]|uniref:Uncharacterized protein n=1 Tax=Chondromyces crocatus TaxID=52 RepID=A0A0K1EFV1_CHOCO|nr:hypothetical protein [Chondromyces crocatus]AKT39463.1 uncharacterized protein CMC5_036100 [Chondromyces crocatus]